MISVGFTDCKGRDVCLGHVLSINPDDDCWFDVVVWKYGRAELSKFEEDHAHIAVSLKDALKTGAYVVGDILTHGEYLKI